MLHKIFSTLRILVGSLDLLHGHLSFASGGHHRCEVKDVALLQMRCMVSSKRQLLSTLATAALLQQTVGLQFDTADKMKFQDLNSQTSVAHERRL